VWLPPQADNDRHVVLFFISSGRHDGDSPALGLSLFLTISIASGRFIYRRLVIVYCWYGHGLLSFLVPEVCKSDWTPASSMISEKAPSI
jgi:hypothetical protein